MNIINEYKYTYSLFKYIKPVINDAEKTNSIYYYIQSNKLNIYKDILHMFPLRLQQIYTILSNKDIYFSIHKWTFLSLDQLYSRYKYMDDLLNNKTLFIDFAYKTTGAGWILVAFFNVENKKIYFRPDGGSNGYDRRDNHNYFLDLNVKNKSMSHNGTIDKWLIKIINDYRHYCINYQ